MFTETLIKETLFALWQTLEMITISGLLAAGFGLPLGVLLSITRKGQFFENIPFYRLLSFLINLFRSLPFIILMLALLPFTRLIVGTAYGIYAAMVPLTIAATPFFARLVEMALNEVSPGLIEAAKAMGASPFQIIYKVMIPESLPSLTSGFTLTLVNLVGYSAMAGAIGAGGLGSLAYHYGYLRFNTVVMLTTVVVLILLVQCIQSAGDYVVHKIFTH